MPVKKLSVFHRVEVNLGVPTQAFHGQVIKWPKNDEIESIYFDGLTPSLTENGSHWMAGVDLYDSSSIWVTGLTRVKKSKWRSLLSYFRGESRPFFAHGIQLSRPFKAKGNKLRLPSSVWKKVSTDHEKKKIYRRRTKLIWKNRDGDLTKSCWNAALNSKINSEFGKPRFLPNGRKYYHSGVDLRAKTGTPLRSIAAATVVFAEGSIVPGNTVILYHGDGVHSQYMHMSRIDVFPGQRLSPGQQIGLSGATGRVEGPHLHWEVRWKGRRVDPFSFLEAIGNPCSPQST